jgi:hypothetical protein
LTAKASIARTVHFHDAGQHQPYAALVTALADDTGLTVHLKVSPPLGRDFIETKVPHRSQTDKERFWDWPPRVEE